MAKKSFLNTTSIIFKVLLFVLAAALVLLVYPREGKFRYQFQEGSPWRYGLLTAPYSFSIYKTEEAIQAERDSALATFQPYVVMDAEAGQRVQSQLEKDYNDYLRATVPSYYLAYLKDQLQLVYSAGIVPAELLNRLEKEHINSVMMVVDNIGERRDRASLFTSKKAYSALLANLPANIDRNVLINDCHLENYLTENCVYDQENSDQARQDLLMGLSLTFGMVQRGERIIDQGELVNHETYLKLVSLKRHSEERNLSSGGYEVLFGQAVWIVLLFLLYFFYLKQMNAAFFARTSNLVFALILMVLLCLFTAFIANNNSLLNVYMVPYAIVPVLFCTFFDSRKALVSHLFTILLCAPMAAFPFEFLMLQSVVGLVTVLTLKDVTQRSQLTVCILLLFLSSAVAYTGIALMQEGSLQVIQWQTFVYLGICAVLMLCSYLLIYLFEWMFGFTSSVTLLELTNINSPLLREFSETCPGTFQHSMQVSNLASAAAQAIGANAGLVRAGALYHDLGKMASPSSFTENQNDNANPLLEMPADQAAALVTSHVAEGLKIAAQHHLPDVIKDFIRTHHGTAPARYFRTVYLNAHPQETEVPACFYYPGPNPFSRETAILMMADTVEAASKSLKKYTVTAIGELVDTLIAQQVNEGYYRDVPLTFQEMEKIKTELKEKLQSIYHTRIAYPAEREPVSQPGAKA